MRFCSKCKQYRSKEEYHINSTRSGGLNGWCKSCCKIYHKQYQQQKKKKVKNLYMREYNKIRNQLDLNFKLKGYLRNRLYRAIKINQKMGSAVKDLGCSIEEFKKYIESKFKEGMSWENYGNWHLDHIRPLSSFDLTNRAAFLKACHYTNIQPLWAVDNLRKSNKI